MHLHTLYDSVEVMWCTCAHVMLADAPLAMREHVMTGAEAALILPNSIILLADVVRLHACKALTCMKLWATSCTLVLWSTRNDVMLVCLDSGPGDCLRAKPHCFVHAISSDKVNIQCMLAPPNSSAHAASNRPCATAKLLLQGTNRLEVCDTDM